ncbi:MAG: Calx-beta domain-containing protein [Pirellula sp.]
MDVPQNISFYTMLGADDTAASGDFVGVANNTTPLSAQTVTFAPGDLTKTFSVATNQDALYELNETFTVVLYALQNVGRQSKISAFNGSAKGTILDNDTLPVFSVSVLSADAGGVVESVTGTTRSIRFVVTRTALSEAAQTIDYATVLRAGDNASELDYVPATGTLTFPSSGTNSLTQTVSVELRNDNIAEPTETFGFRISNPSLSASSLGSPSEATGTILDSNQLPTTGESSVTPLEDTRYIFKVADFNYADNEGMPLTNVRVVSLPSATAGVLRLATSYDAQGRPATWTDVTAGQEISVSGTFGIEGGGLFFDPVANKNNLNLSVISFTHQVRDDKDFSIQSGTVTINITPVNDAPASANDTVIAHQREVYVFKDQADFNFSDPNDVPVNNRLEVIITGLPLKGKLLYKSGASWPSNGITLNNQGEYIVSFQDIMDGKFGYLAGDNDPVSSPSTTFPFKVRDDGGTTDGGVNTSGQHTMTINLQDYRGPRQSVPIEQTIDEDTSLVFSTANGNAITVSFEGDETNVDKTLETTLSVDPSISGVLALGSEPQNLTIVKNGNSYTLTGTATLINQALDGLSFTPPVNANSVTQSGGHTYAILTISTINKPPAGQTQWTQDTDTVDIGVRPVNDAPVASGSASLTAVTEDATDPAGATVATLFASNFSDATDQVTGGSSANTLAGIAITGYSRDANKGEWQYRNNAASGGWTTIGASINGDSSSRTYKSSDSLRFLPAGNFNGPAPTLTVRLIESSTPSAVVTDAVVNVSNNGGITSISAATVVLSTSVNADNDAPTILPGSAPSLAVISEDNFDPAGATVTSLLSGSFSDADDNQLALGGTDERNNFAGIAIVGYTRAATKGEWWYKDNANSGAWTQIASSITGDATSLTLKATDSLRFVPVANFNGQAPALSVRLIETPRSITTGATVDVSGSNNGGTTTVSAATVTLTHTVNAVNDAPVVVNSSATLPAILEGNVNPSGATVAFLFNLSFNDQKDNVVSGSQANTLAGVAINKYNYNAATDIGVWQYSVDGGANWLDLSAISSDSNAFILKRTDMMRFLPKDTDVNGTPPVLEARLIDSSWVNLTTGSGNVSTNGDPTAISSSVVTLTTSVTSVNDAPEGPTGKSITPNEDTTYTFTPANFGYQDGFTDPKDSPANNFIKVVITTLPTAGTIQLNGQNISAGTAISLRDLQEGNLKYIPVANASGSPYATLTFQVRDDGGTANGGVDTDSTPRTMTINVLSVNDAPTSQNKTVWTDEDVAYAFGGSDFAFFDANDTPANALASVTITSLPTVGTLALSGSNVTVGQVIDADQLANLSFTPVPDANGNNYATVGFRVTDNGGTDRGGVNTSVSAYTITINVDPVNDAPAPTGNATLASVFKTNTDPAGATVSSLFGSVFSDPLDSGTQKDNFAGIAITTHTIDSAKGDWEYQASGAGSWLPISNATLSSAFTLKDTDKIRFKPNSSYTGAATPLAARLIETPTNPTTAAVLNLTGLVGGTTTYSALEAQLNHQVQGGLLVKGPSDVSEGTRAVFSVSLDSSSSETVVTLSLDNIGLSAESDDYESVFNANAASPDASLVLVYYLDGSNQPVYLAASGGVVTIPSGITKIYVSVPTTQNSIYEGAESFRLTASIDGSNASDTSTILDNGRGVEYNQDGTPKGSLTYTPDNDLTVDVTAINTVNEGSDYSFFTVLGSSGDSLRLSLGNPTSGTAASLVSPRIDYAVLRPDGTTQAADWTQYNGTTNLPLVPGALGSGTGVVFVRVSIVSEQDTVYEGAESFTLTATSVENSAKNDVDTSTIVDDGSGKKFGPELSGGAPSESTTNLDDDRALTVTAYGPVNELRTAVGTMYSMFKVTAPAGSTLNLSLGNDVTNPALIAGFTMEYLNQGTWVPYSSSNRPSVPNVGQTGDVYVRVNVHSEWDALATNSSFFEGTERFRLIATTQTNRSSSGIGEIIDDGTGNVYTGAWPSGSSTPTTLSAQLDDDRVWATDNSLFTNIQAVVTVDARANDGAVSGVTISDQIDLNPATSAVDSDLIVNGQGTWSVVSGNITYTRLASYTLDPTPITYAIRPTDRPGNFSRNTATVTIDFPVIAQPDSNALVDSSGNPVSPGTEVLIEVLANDLAGDAPVGSTLRFASNDSTTLNVSGQGVWTIVLVSGKYYVKFTPEIGFVGDPTPVNYVVNDEQGNVSAPTKVSVVYNRGGAFVVRVDDKSASGFDVVIVDNQPAGRTIDLGGVSVTTTVADTNSTLGRIAWTGLTSNFSRIQVDAKSKPVLTAAMADITLIVNATSSAAGTVEVQAMDMGYNLVSGNWTLASPLGGINYGSVTFSETLGLSNEPFPTSSSVRNASPAQTARTLNWSRSSSFTLGASTSVSLMKSVTIAHTRGSLTTQAQAGGKLVETSAPVDMRPYLDWVLPVGAAFDTSAPASTVTAVERKSSGFETAAPAEIFKKIGSVAIASTFGIVDTDALSDRSLGEQTSEVSEFGKMTPDARLKNRLNLRGRIK